MSTGSAEPFERGGSSGVAGDASADWSCGDSECKHVNFGRRTSCQKCNRERSLEYGSSGSSGHHKKKLGTEIGKAAAEKSRGLFSAEDWQCSKCANVNWARRQTCNMCNAPKFCEVEERTGYGGGYNDRGVVEYKERSESDSEYDEFGRLKKRKSQKQGTDKKDRESEVKNNSKIVKAVVKEEEEEEDEEEDEDEDGDGDLSKYDLWGDDEVAAIAKKPQKTDNSKTSTTGAQKRHTSRSSSSSSRSSASSSSSSSSSSFSSTDSSSSTSSSASTRSRHSKPKSNHSARSSARNTRSRSRQRLVPAKEDSKAPLARLKESRERSHTRRSSQQSGTSSRKYSRHNSRTRSRSSSSARKRRRAEQTGKDKRRSRSRSNSSLRKNSTNSHAAKYKRNSSRSPNTRYRRRTRSRSVSPGKRKH